MEKKKIIKIIIISVCAIILFLTFMYRVTIYNKIGEMKVESATKASNNQPDYILTFINNVKTSATGKGYSYNEGETIWFFKEAGKVLYGNYNDDTKKQVSFIFGTDKYYNKPIILDLEPNMLDKIVKYQQTRLIYQYKNYTPQDGDIDLHSFTYNNSSVQSVVSYRIKKSDASELYELLEQVKNSK